MLVEPEVALAAICAHSCNSTGLEGRNSHQQQDVIEDSEYLFLNMNLSASMTGNEEAIPKNRT